MRARHLLVALLLGAPVVAPAVASAQWKTTYETFYLQAPHNWYFRNQYQGADRLFNAFDYGHAILYETLWNRPDAPASELEQKEYDYLTKTVLVRPPRVPLEEAAIEVNYAKLAPEAKAMFDWSHILHRQIYDVLADERLDQGAKDREVERLIAYYKTRKDLAFSSRPKSMALMQEQPYSLAFRKKYPKFNGLIWGYHWMQVGLYEPLLVGRSAEERQAGVRATVARFWQMLGDPPKTLPYQMPMTAAVAREFAKRYPEAAIIFDNLHSMHDVVSDILANPNVPHDRKGAEIALAARRFRDDTTLVMASVEAWRTMAQEMGVENMGGPAVNFLPTLPTPTVTYGAVMQHDDRTGKMVGMKYGEMTGAHGGHAMPGMTAMPGMSATPGARAMSNMSDMSHAQHADTTRADTTQRAMLHDSRHASHGATHVMPGMDSASHRMMQLHERMMADPVIRARVERDPEMRRMMQEMMPGMPDEHRAHADTPKASAKSSAKPASSKARTAKTKAAKPPAPKPTKQPDPMPNMPGMDHSTMPGMKKP